MRGILAFDGRCGMCTRAVNRLARWDRIAAAVEAYGALTDHVFRLAMEAVGFHQHKRGEWRRSRGK